MKKILMLVSCMIPSVCMNMECILTNKTSRRIGVEFKSTSADIAYRFALRHGQSQRCFLDEADRSYITLRTLNDDDDVDDDRQWTTASLDQLFFITKSENLEIQQNGEYLKIKRVEM